MVDIQLHSRPGFKLTEEIAGLIRSLTGTWFTEQVAEEMRRDLLLQDVLCLYKEGRLTSFTSFTSLEGALHITWMATHPDEQGRGYGSRLLSALIHHGQTLGFPQIKLWTVPPETNARYACTIRFYEKHQFMVVKRYADLWEGGAVEMS
ncbi:hypothetical protein XYCOK13_24470 [Xylanibacillus composti]|uniref:N-acetyltransferase domain-containing protein n=2 Tax=Xylanibacillus composti TaxID=1572762 RepID=A0A8J4H6J8_9BACL|nr:hypothetical protein XYCOK13_24470 [Xylanibacillus composti]